MNRPFLREVAKRAGYSVHLRSSHGVSPAYDWSPKGPMDSRHFKSEEEAWDDVEKHIHSRLEQADKLIRISQEIIGETIHD